MQKNRSFVTQIKLPILYYIDKISFLFYPRKFRNHRILHQQSSWLQYPDTIFLLILKLLPKTSILLITKKTVKSYLCTKNLTITMKRINSVICVMRISLEAINTIRFNKAERYTTMIIKRVRLMYCYPGLPGRRDLFSWVKRTSLCPMVRNSPSDSSWVLERARISLCSRFSDWRVRTSLFARLISRRFVRSD